MKRFIKLFLSFMIVFFTVTIGTSTWVINTTNAAGQAIINKDEQTKAIAYIIGDTLNRKFLTIEAALNDAKSGDIVTVYPATKANYHNVNNKIVPDKVSYTISNNCEIKPGVTFLIPTDSTNLNTVKNSSSLNSYINTMQVDNRNKDNTTPRGSTDTYSGDAETNENLYLRTTITLKDNVILTNNGTLIVSGYLSGGSGRAGKIGQTSHSYSKILLGTNAKIVQSNANAKTYCYGYIDELSSNNNSLVKISTGLIYIPFVVNDYKGLSISFGMTGKDGAIEAQKCTPFNRFVLKNVSAKIQIWYEASCYAIVNLFVNESLASINVAQNFDQTILLVGNQAEAVCKLSTTTAYVENKYNKNANVMNLDFYNGFKLNKILITMNAPGGITVNLNTATAYFPISYQYNIHFKKNTTSNATFDLTSQMIKLLPGSRLEIDSGCIINGNELINYSAFYDGDTGTDNDIIFKMPSSYPLKPGAICIFNDGASCTFNKIAGNIYCNNPADIKSTSKEIISKEPWNFASNPGFTPIGSDKRPYIINDYLEIREKLSVVNIVNLNYKKIYVALNTFTKYNSYLPCISLKPDTSANSTTIDSNQQIVHIQNINNYSISFIRNIRSVIDFKTRYVKDSQIQYLDGNNYICGIGSNISISNNNNGKNEFEVQSINIEVITKPVSGKIPLWPTSSIQLKANVVDINKLYDNKIIWSSSNEAIAKVDTNGIVTGVAKGPVTITATVSGVSSSIQLDVIDEITDVNYINSITITDNYKNSSKVVAGQDNSSHKDYNGGYKNNKNITFTANLEPVGGIYDSIRWEHALTGTQKGRSYLVDGTYYPSNASDSSYDHNATEGYYVLNNNSKTCTLHTTKGTNTSDDTSKLRCIVTVNGKEIEEIFVINHLHDISCIAPGSLISMSDGTLKKVEDLKINDTIVSFNHETGKYEKTPLLAIVKHRNAINTIVKMSFDDGSSMKISNGHDVFDYNTMQYEFIDEGNIEKFIGHKFITYDKANIKTKKLVDYQVYEEKGNAYMLASFINKNFIVNNTLTGDHEINYFDFDEDLRYNQKTKENDLKKNGIYSYNEWKDKVPYFMYVGFNFRYYKQLVAKGIITYEDMLLRIEESNSLIENKEVIYNTELYNLYPNPSKII